MAASSENSAKVARSGDRLNTGALVIDRTYGAVPARSRIDFFSVCTARKVCHALLVYGVVITATRKTIDAALSVPSGEPSIFVPVSASFSENVVVVNCVI